MPRLVRTACNRPQVSIIVRAADPATSGAIASSFLFVGMTGNERIGPVGKDLTKLRREAGATPGHGRVADARA
jgi:hypothetical protein